jgi:hypothetical protein
MRYGCLSHFFFKGTVFAELGAILRQEAGSVQPVAAIKQLEARMFSKRCLGLYDLLIVEEACTDTN